MFITYLYDRTARVGFAGVAVDVFLTSSFFNNKVVDQWECKDEK